MNELVEEKIDGKEGGKIDQRRIRNIGKRRRIDQDRRGRRGRRGMRIYWEGRGGGGLGIEEEGEEEEYSIR